MSMLSLLEKMKRDALTEEYTIKTNNTNVSSDNISIDNNYLKIIKFNVFTDGSEIKHKKTYKSLGVGWAYSIKNETFELLHSDSNYIDNTIGNNQRAELVAIYEAFKSLWKLVMKTKLEVDTFDSIIEIHLYTDSDYSIKSITKWSKTWRKNGWKTSKNESVKHRDVIEPLMNLYDKMMINTKLNVHHIRSHTRKTDPIHIGNEEVDKLARKRALEYMHNHNICS